MTFGSPTTTTIEDNHNGRGVERTAAEETEPALAIAAEKDQLECRVRSRIPTPSGNVFFHLYRHTRNGRVLKEHYAFVSGTQFQSQSLLESLHASGGDERRREEEAVQRGIMVEGACQDRAKTWPETCPETSADSPIPLVRIHSECFTGETLLSQRCDCGEQLQRAMELISREPLGGVVVYLKQEGRGIGLEEKLKAYNLQDQFGFDTVTANEALRHGPDLREYSLGARVLRDLGITRIRLLTNNPDKIGQLEASGIEVVERVPLVHPFCDAHWKQEQAAEKEEQDAETTTTTSNASGSTVPPELLSYLRTKVARMGHLMEFPEGNNGNHQDSQQQHGR